MFVRSLHNIALLVALSGLAGCSGGGSTAGAVSFSCTGGAPRAMCLQSCSLGCSATGCSRTDIAQNEIVILNFSDQIDSSTVGPSSIRFRTAAGDQPVGEFFVNGNRIEFIPSLAIRGGQTFYGFSSGETYTMTILGGEGQTSVIRSTGGRPFDKTLTCTLQSTRGIVDLNGVPPRATLVVPTNVTAAPLDTDVVLEFNELIDATPFVSGTNSPVEFRVRRTLAGTSDCDPNSTPQTVNGTQDLDFDAGSSRSILTFHPSQPLPGNSCVDITVTSAVTDLSGKPAQPQVFTIQTAVVAQTEQQITEEFDVADQLDADASGAQWTGGVVVFSPIGGDGRHGPFNLGLCTEFFPAPPIPGKRVYALNCDSTIIPGSNTTTGSAINVSDGKFFFSTMVVPADAIVVCTGVNPPVITVAGRVDVLGDLVVAADFSSNPLVAPPTVPGSTSFPGQPGGVGSNFGSNGGKGGDRIVAPAVAQPANQGEAGRDARLLAGHAYAASTLGTGGRGSVVQPASGSVNDMQFGVGATTSSFTWPCLSASAGGGGGGLWTAGGLPRVTPDSATGLGFVGHMWNSHLDLTLGTVPRLDVMGPVSGPSNAVTLFPFPAGSGFSRSSQHFLVGGSGGGGAASSPCMTFFLLSARAFAPGCGGGAGGGALALRAGGTLRVAPTGRLLARGGSAANVTGPAASSAQPSPGGGGSGGSIILQSGRTADIGGVVDVRGGLGGQFDRASSGIGPAGGRVKIAGGNGSAGYARLELPTAPTLTQFGTMQPAASASNLGALTETDDLAVCRSKIYSTGLIFGPDYARYEIYATVDGLPVVFSDDPAVSTTPAQIGAPVRALFQCVDLNLATGQPLSFSPWRTAVRTSSTQTGIASSALNAFRFILLLDRAVSTNVVIQKIAVVYRV